MLKNKIIAITLGMFIVVVIAISGCQKDTTVYIPLAAPSVTKTVSFSKDLVPIFTANCAKSGCHVAGGKSPNLTADKAYSSIVDGGLINKATPESSKIYERLTGKLTPSMPIGGAANPSNIEGLLIAWIKQGAKKN
jgi:hypothetical protein